VVVFDLGKVLLDFDYGIAARKIAARARAGATEVERFIGQSELLFRFETGQIDSEQFFREVCAATGFAGNFTEFRDFFANIFTPITAMIELHARLRERQMPTYIFSNTNDLAIHHIRRTFPFFAHFTGYILSYEHGVMKPDPRLYEVVERVTGRRGLEILYLDDRQENVEAGLARGWQVIHHESPDRTIPAVVGSKLLPDSR
jgi:HAD superfamily hydrolase (TIGR01509 family)